MEREDISSLYLRIEEIRESDPRSKGSVDDLISLYAEIVEVIKAAGWNEWEYEATLCSVYA